MGYSVYDQTINGQERDAGYGVVAYCDHPGCFVTIDRGIGYACCDNPSHTASCGGFYCEDHRYKYVYEDEIEDMDPEELARLGLSKGDTAHDLDGILRCTHEPIESKDHPVWAAHVATDETWAEWRSKCPEQFQQLQDNAAKCHARAKEAEAST